MPLNYFQPLGNSEILPRYAFFEPLLKEASVLELGAVAATAGRAAALLRERGARSVVALDADSDAVDRARRAWASDPELRFAAGGLADLPAGPFDLVLVADAAEALSAAVGLDTLMARLGPGGRLALGLRNPAGASLAQLFCDEKSAAHPTLGQMLQELSARFPSVEVFAQTMAVGYHLAPTRPAREPELSVDATLTEPMECAYFLALAGPKPSGLTASQSLVTLPGPSLVVAASLRSEAILRLRLAQRESDAAPAERQAAEAERDGLLARLARVERELLEERILSEQDRARVRGADERAGLAERQNLALSSQLEEARGRAEQARAEALAAAQRAAQAPGAKDSG